MRSASILICIALVAVGCTTSTAPKTSNLGAESTLKLCRILIESTDQDYRRRAAELLIKRGATAEKCQRLVASDNSMATSVALSGAAVAAGAVAANNGYGGGYYPHSSSYGVAWDQFYNQYYQTMWRCRDKASGRFVDDYRCAGMPMIDTTWPGWSA